MECGLDLVDVERVRDLVQRHGSRFLARVFTDREVVHCQGRVERLAARIAAKEAVAKALGTGLAGVGWREIEIVSEEGGKPTVRLHGRARVVAAAAGLTGFSVSLTHTAAVAGAVAVAYGVPVEP